MKCPSCASVKVCVLDSRRGSDTVRRRRGCKVCGFRWTTMEVDRDQVPFMKDRNLQAPETR